MQTYDSYKNSGIEWLGEIPSHWEMIPNRYLFQLKKNQVGKRSGEYDLLSLTVRGIIKRDMENPEGKFPAEFDTYQEVKINDFVFCLFDVEETPRTVGLSSFDGMITGAYTVMEPSESSMSKYLYYYYLNIDDRKQLKYLYRGLRNTIPKENFFGLKTALPPSTEQEAIAAFLDEKCGKIDELVSVKEQQVALLKERRQVVIHEAVTKGIQPNVVMKDSGIDWIGEIPSHWEVSRAKNHVDLLTGFPFKSENFTEKGVKLARGINVKEGVLNWKDLRCWSNLDDFLDKYYLEEGDVLLGMDGSKVGKNCAYVKKEDLPILLVQRVARLRCKETTISEFLYTNYRSISFLNWVNVSKTDPMVPHISPDDILNYIIPIPPISEQEAIVAYLEEQTGKIDQAIALKTEQIEKLKAYKQSLINEVVTGKVKVA